MRSLIIALAGIAISATYALADGDSNSWKFGTDEHTCILTSPAVDESSVNRLQLEYGDGGYAIYVANPDGNKTNVNLSVDVSSFNYIFPVHYDANAQAWVADDDEAQKPLAQFVAALSLQSSRNNSLNVKMMPIFMSIGYQESKQIESARAFQSCARDVASDYKAADPTATYDPEAPQEALHDSTPMLEDKLNRGYQGYLTALKCKQAGYPISDRTTDNMKSALIKFSALNLLPKSQRDTLWNNNAKFVDGLDIRTGMSCAMSLDTFKDKMSEWYSDSAPVVANPF